MSTRDMQPMITSSHLSINRDLIIGRRLDIEQPVQPDFSSGKGKPVNIITTLENRPVVYEKKKLIVYIPEKGTKAAYNYGMFATFFVSGNKPEALELDSYEMAIAVTVHAISMFQDSSNMVDFLADACAELGTEIILMPYTETIHKSTFLLKEGFKDHCMANRKLYGDRPHTLNCPIISRFLAICKRLQGEYFVGWMGTRLEALMYSMGLRPIDKISVSGQIDFKVYDRLQCVVSASFHLRKSIFIAIAKAADANKNNIIKPLARAIMVYMDYNDMIHIPIIAMHIVQKHPELMVYSRLKGEFVAVMLIVYSYTVLPYLRYLYTKSELQPFERQNMQQIYTYNTVFK